MKLILVTLVFFRYFYEIKNYVISINVFGINFVEKRFLRTA